MQSEKLKIVFMGTPEFGAVILEGLVKSDYKPVLVITAQDKPVGRKQVLTPSPVKVIAEKYNVPVEQTAKIENHSPYTYGLGPAPAHRGGGLKLKIENLKPDLGIVAAYGRILPNNILSIPKYGFINVHPSLLPRWRGPSPVQFAILNSDDKAGVTVIKITEKVDAGLILIQKELKLEGNETYDVLHNKLGEIGSDLLIKIIPQWIAGKIKAQPQDESKATYTKILKREDGRIDWKKSARDLERQIRAFNPWPESFTFWEKSGELIRIKILKARVYKSPRNTGGSYSIGKTLVVPQNEIGVQCGDGDFLVIESLQLEGKKEIGAEEFLRGHLDFIGTILK